MDYIGTMDLFYSQNVQMCVYTGKAFDLHDNGIKKLEVTLKNGKLSNGLSYSWMKMEINRQK